MSPTPHLALWLYIPLAALALLALLTLHFALIRDRAGAAKRRCPKCWYDMSGAPPAPPFRCPECGHLSPTDRDLRRTRRRWPLAILGALLLAPLLVFFGLRDGARAYYALMPKWKLAEEIRFGSTIAKRYVIRDPDERGGRFILTSRDKVVLDAKDIDIELGQRPFLGLPSIGGSPHVVGAGEDLNPGGKRYLVVFAYSGGAHCCYTVYVIELSEPPRILATIDARNGMGVSRAAPGDPHYAELEFDIADQSFDYWNAPHVASPSPDVWYRISGDHLEIALDRMLNSLRTARGIHSDPTQQVLASMSPAGSPLDPSLWSYMLNLLYSGNEDACWDFFDHAWPASRPGKDDFKQDFLAILDKSPQWHDFQAACEAAAQGKPIPPATVGNYTPAPPSTLSTSPRP